MKKIGTSCSGCILMEFDERELIELVEAKVLISRLEVVLKAVENPVRARPCPSVSSRKRSKK